MPSNAQELVVLYNFNAQKTAQGHLGKNYTNQYYSIPDTPSTCHQISKGWFSSTHNRTNSKHNQVKAVVCDKHLDIYISLIFS